MESAEQERIARAVAVLKRNFPDMPEGSAGLLARDILGAAGPTPRELQLQAIETIGRLGAQEDEFLWVRVPDVERAERQLKDLSDLLPRGCRVMLTALDDIEIDSTLPGRLAAQFPGVTEMRMREALLRAMGQQVTTVATAIGEPQQPPDKSRLLRDLPADLPPMFR